MNKYLNFKMPELNPNGYLRFKTALGTETDINVHVKISGPICIWLDGTKLYLPDQEQIKKQAWFKECEKKHGKYQGVFQRDTKIEIPGEAKPNNKLNW